MALGGHDGLLACPSLSRALLPQHSKTADIYSVLFWSHEPVTLVKGKKWDDWHNTTQAHPGTEGWKGERKRPSSE